MVFNVTWSLNEAEMQLHKTKVDINACVTKPVDLGVLLLRACDLMRTQQQHKKLFKYSIIIQSEEIAGASIDQQFIEKVLKIIDKNLENSSFSVDKLSKEMNMERTGLYKKLIATTGHSPSFLIRAIRLKKSIFLLKQKRFGQVEIAERIGFSSAAYFSKCFKKEYGVSPSQYKKDLTSSITFDVRNFRLLISTSSS